MTDKTISQLDRTTVANPSDLVPIVQSGTTKAIQVSNLIGSTITSIAALKAISVTELSNNEEVYVLGYYTPGDGGGGPFYWNSTSTATDNGGSVIQVTGVATGRWVRLTTVYTPEMFGAKADGSTDDTTAVQALITFAENFGVVGTAVDFTQGKKYKCSFSLTSPNSTNPSTAATGMQIRGNKCTLIGRAADNNIIKVNPPASPLSYCNGLDISGFDLDMTAMANAASTAGILWQRSYGSKLHDIHVIGEPASGFGLDIEHNCYTSLFENINCTNIKVQGNTPVDATSTLTFLNCNLFRYTMDAVFSINVIGGAMESNSLTRFVLNNVDHLTVLGCDLAGSATVFDCTSGNVTSLWEANNVGGGGANWVTGVAAGSYFGSRSKYNRANLYGSDVLALPGVGPNVIWTFYGESTGGGFTQSDALIQVSGGDGSNGYTDLLLVAGSTVKTVSSNTTYGAPPTRTYAITGSNTLTLTLGSYLAQNTKVTVISAGSGV